MWTALPKGILIKCLGYLFVSIILIGIQYVSKFNSFFNITDNNTFFNLIKLTIPTTLLFVGIVFLLGKYIWKYLWQMPILGKILNTIVCPDLNGEWSGKVISNFPKDQNQSTEVDVKATIRADMFGFCFKLESVDGYQRSTVTMSSIVKDAKTNYFYLDYVFEAEVDLPKESDDRLFDGAGRLKVIFEKEKVVCLSGLYWTNRAWQRGQNTAGQIKLQRRNYHKLQN